MKVTLLGHTQLSLETKNALLQGDSSDFYLNRYREEQEDVLRDGQIIALAAIRQCYSHKTALEVLETESEKYFGDRGQEGKRLFNHIVKSGHTSTLEHIHFTFAVESVSRALLAQLTRHRQLSFSVQSQRYNKFSSDSKSGGFDYVVPDTIANHDKTFIEKNYSQVDYEYDGASELFGEAMDFIQMYYDKLIAQGIPQEDARAVLPNAATCNLVTSSNLRAWLEFYKKRKKGEGAQHEITQFAELIKNAIIDVEPWTSDYFELN